MSEPPLESRLRVKLLTIRPSGTPEHWKRGHQKAFVFHSTLIPKGVRCFVLCTAAQGPEVSKKTGISGWVLSEGRQISFSGEGRWVVEREMDTPASWKDGGLEGSHFFNTQTGC